MKKNNRLSWVLSSILSMGFIIIPLTGGTCAGDPSGSEKPEDSTSITASSLIEKLQAAKKADFKKIVDDFFTNISDKDAQKAELKKLGKDDQNVFHVLFSHGELDLAKKLYEIDKASQEIKDLVATKQDKNKKTPIDLFAANSANITNTSLLGKLSELDFDIKTLKLSNGDTLAHVIARISGDTDSKADALVYVLKLKNFMEEAGNNSETVSAILVANLAGSKVFSKLVNETNLAADVMVNYYAALTSKIAAYTNRDNISAVTYTPATGGVAEKFNSGANDVTSAFASNQTEKNNLRELASVADGPTRLSAGNNALIISFLNQLPSDPEPFTTLWTGIQSVISGGGGAAETLIGKLSAAVDSGARTALLTDAVLSNNTEIAKKDAAGNNALHILFGKGDLANAKKIHDVSGALVNADNGAGKKPIDLLPIAVFADQAKVNQLNTSFGINFSTDADAKRVALGLAQKSASTASRNAALVNLLKAGVPVYNALAKALVANIAGPDATLTAAFYDQLSKAKLTGGGDVDISKLNTKLITKLNAYANRKLLADNLSFVNPNWSFKFVDVSNSTIFEDQVVVNAGAEANIANFATGDPAVDNTNLHKAHLEAVKAALADDKVFTKLADKVETELSGKLIAALKAADYGDLATKLTKDGAGAWKYKDNSNNDQTVTLDDDQKKLAELALALKTATSATDILTTHADAVAEALAPAAPGGKKAFADLAAKVKTKADNAAAAALAAAKSLPAELSAAADASAINTLVTTALAIADADVKEARLKETDADGNNALHILFGKGDLANAKKIHDALTDKTLVNADNSAGEKPIDLLPDTEIVKKTILASLKDDFGLAAAAVSTAAKLAAMKASDTNRNDALLYLLAEGVPVDNVLATALVANIAGPDATLTAAFYDQLSKTKLTAGGDVDISKLNTKLITKLNAYANRKLLADNLSFVNPNWSFKFVDGSNSTIFENTVTLDANDQAIARYVAVNPAVDNTNLHKAHLDAVKAALTDDTVFTKLANKVNTELNEKLITALKAADYGDLATNLSKDGAGAWKYKDNSNNDQTVTLDDDQKKLAELALTLKTATSATDILTTHADAVAKALTKVTAGTPTAFAALITAVDTKANAAAAAATSFPSELSAAADASAINTLVTTALAIADADAKKARLKETDSEGNNALHILFGKGDYENIKKVYNADNTLINKTNNKSEKPFDLIKDSDIIELNLIKELKTYFNLSLKDVANKLAVRLASIADGGKALLYLLKEGLPLDDDIASGLISTRGKINNYVLSADFYQDMIDNNIDLKKLDNKLINEIKSDEFYKKLADGLIYDEDENKFKFKNADGKIISIYKEIYKKEIYKHLMSMVLDVKELNHADKRGIKRYLSAGLKKVYKKVREDVLWVYIVDVEGYEDIVSEDKGDLDKVESGNGFKFKSKDDSVGVQTINLDDNKEMEKLATFLIDVVYGKLDMDNADHEVFIDKILDKTSPLNFKALNTELEKRAKAASSATTP